MNPEHSHSLNPDTLAHMLEQERLQFADEFALFLYGTDDIDDTQTDFGLPDHIIEDELRYARELDSLARTFRHDMPTDESPF